ncbi:MAG: hypothetical protein JW914_02950 [Syntrophaceae bacterium]|nr:hypothetical protein [Syntrophaceae bacterium]
MLSLTYPAFTKFLKNCIGRIDIIGVPERQAVANYVNAINVSEKEMLIEETSKVISDIENHIDDIAKIGNASFADVKTAKEYFISLVEYMR